MLAITSSSSFPGLFQNSPSCSHLSGVHFVLISLVHYHVPVQTLMQQGRKYVGSAYVQIYNNSCSGAHIRAHSGDFVIIRRQLKYPSSPFATWFLRRTRQFAFYLRELQWLTFNCQIKRYNLNSECRQRSLCLFPYPHSYCSFRYVRYYCYGTVFASLI